MGFLHLTNGGVVELFGVKLVGVSSATGHKLILTVIFIAVVYLLGRLLQSVTRAVNKGKWGGQRTDFWAHQAISVSKAILLIVGLLSIWFSNPAQLGSALGFVTAGLAFALQKVVTAVAAYLVILRGKTFNVGDRIQMGGVRGDVVALGFIQTTIMEMGEPPAEQSDPPGMWVRARQYTGRIVTVTNDKIFDEPVYNYSREFPYIWEEMNIPIAYKDKRRNAEQIILDVVRRNTVDTTQMGEELLRELEQRYYMHRSDLGPRVFFRLTDNWIEMSVRFLVRPYDVRSLKDKISREMIDEFDKAGIGIASSTYDIVGMPPIQVTIPPNPGNGAQTHNVEQVHADTSA